jgi:hypothetical protein
MFSLFAPKLPIDSDELEWQLATFKWLGAEFGPAGEAPLVLPTAEYFPPSIRKGKGRVEDLFASVRAAAGMDDWPCELRAGAGDRPAHVGTGLLLRHEGARGRSTASTPILPPASRRWTSATSPATERAGSNSGHSGEGRNP